MVRPLWFEGELALCVDFLNGRGDGGDGGDPGLFQGPPKFDVILKAGKVQSTSQSDFLGFSDFGWQLDRRSEGCL